MAGLPSYTELCQVEPGKLNNLLRHWSTATSGPDVTEYLEHGVAIEALTAQTLATWLTISPTVRNISRLLRNDFSIGTRCAAIKAFAKALTTDRAEELWSAVGGVQGLLDWFNDASVNEVKLMSHALGSLGTAKKNLEQIRASITTLLHALFWNKIPNAELKSNDRRDLARHHCYMLSACTEDFVKIWLDTSGLAIPRMHNLLIAHPKLMQQRALQPFIKKKGLGFSGGRLSTQLYTSMPAEPTEIPGISASFAFDIQVMDAILSKPKHKHSAHDLESYVVRPLLKKLLDGRMTVPKDHFFKIFEKLVTLCTQHNFTSRVVYSGSQICNMVNRLWAMYPQELEPALCRFYSCHSAITRSTMDGMLKRIVPDLRYHLLKLMLKHAPTHKLDLDGVIEKHTPANERVREDLQWHEDMFFKLRPLEALSLLEQLEQRQAIEHITTSARHRGTNLDVDQCIERLRLRLLRGKHGALERAKESLDQAKKKAEAERDPEKRTSAVQVAFSFSIASGDLTLLKRTIIWLRRYTKDSTVSQGIFANTQLLHADLATLLSGIPDKELTKEASLASIAANVEAANEILELLAESAFLGMKEPNFYAPAWAPVFALMPHVVACRASSLPFVRPRVAMTNDEIMSAIWEPTVQTWLKIEEMLCNEDNKRMQQQSLTAQGRWTLLYCIAERNQDSTILPFLDRLARGRDALWAKKRRAEEPGMVDLPTVWPAGLPIQHLVPFPVGKKSDAFAGIPYVTERAKAIVFRKRDEITGVSRELESSVKSLVVGFVDSYQEAMKCWLAAASRTQPRDDHIRQLWRHAVENFSMPDENAEDLTDFWSDVYRRALGKLPADIEHHSGESRIELFPRDGTSMMSEWNPQKEEKPQVTSGMKSRALPFVDWTLRDELPGSHFDHNHILVYPLFYDPTLFAAHRSIPDKLAAPTIAEREAYIAATIMFIEARQCETVGVMSEEFPRRDAVRFPALFLDHDFLENKKQNEDTALKILKHYKQSVPLTLLSRLIHSRETTQQKQPEKTNYALSDFTLLSLLASTDNPRKALDLIIRFVLGRPADSAWHRLVLHKGLLNNLRSKDVNKFLKSFSDGIFDILNERHKPKEQKRKAETELTKEKEGKQQNAAQLKVSTIKMLADLVNEPQYMSRTESLKIMTDLFMRVKHVDMRVVVLQGVTDMLLSNDTTLKDDEAQRQIWKVLEAAALHAAELKEQHPLSEAEWRAAEENKEVPEVSEFDGTRDTTAPIRQKLLWILRQMDSYVKAPQLTRYVERVIIPMVDRSAENHVRWTKLFLAAHNLGGSLIGNMPGITVDPNMLSTIINSHARVLPVNYLEALHRYAGFVAVTPQEVNDIIEASATTPSLRDKGGKHFKYVWGMSLHRDGLMNSALNQDFDPPLEGMISLELVQETVKRQLEDFLLSGSMLKGFFTTSMNGLKPGIEGNHREYDIWQKKKAPVFVYAVDKIDSLRTQKWQHNADRVPDELPEPLEWRSWLLPYPTLPVKHSDSWKVETFSHAVHQLLTAAVDGPVPYHRPWAWIKTIVGRMNSSRFAPELALELGTLAKPEAETQPLIVWLTLELADALADAFISKNSYYWTRSWSKNDIARVRKLQTMIEEWQTSPIENIRTMGRAYTSRFASIKANDAEDDSKIEDATASEDAMDTDEDT